jgi:hypothetical protein
MTKLCHNKNSAIYEDGYDWVWKADGQNDIVYKKIDNPLFPLAAEDFEKIRDVASVGRSKKTNAPAKKAKK